jgi:rubrerythrin
MAGIFSASDVLTAAQEIEQRGKVFYTRLAETAIEPQLADTFRFLAQEEEKHWQVFHDLARRVGEVELPAWATEEEYVEYLTALIDAHALFRLGDMDALRRFGGGREEALAAAMGFEKDTIVFFLEMRELVPQGEKAAVDACVAEERRHLRLLAGLLRR